MSQMEEYESLSKEDLIRLLRESRKDTERLNFLGNQRSFWYLHSMADRPYEQLNTVISREEIDKAMERS
jgi:hypothetical protein